MALLAASGREDKDVAGRCDRRIEEMLKGALAGDFKALAAAWGEPAEMVGKRAAAFWQAKRKVLGEVKGLEVLGTVARTHNLFTFVRVDFEREAGFFIYVWDKEGVRLMDMRESESLESRFEPRSQNEFVSPAIGTAIVFEEDEGGRVVLTIRKNGAETRAMKSAA